MYPMMMPPRPSITAESRSVRTLSYWGAGVGATLVLLLAFVVISTYLTFSRSEQLTGPSDGSMFHGADVFFAWLLGNVVAGFGIVILAIAALVLDISVLVKLSGLRGYGAPREASRALTIAVLTGMGLISTPVGAVLMLLPVTIIGSGPTTNALLMVILAALLVVPLAGRIAQANFGRRLVERLPAPPTGWTPEARPGSW